MTVNRTPALLPVISTEGFLDVKVARGTRESKYAVTGPWGSGPPDGLAEADGLIDGETLMEIDALAEVEGLRLNEGELLGETLSDIDDDGEID